MLTKPELLAKLKTGRILKAADTAEPASCTFAWKSWQYDPSADSVLRYQGFGPTGRFAEWISLELALCELITYTRTTTWRRNY